MLVYSIVVTYNGEKWIDKCFSSLLNTKFSGDHKVIVIDNGSKDNTVTILRNNFPDVEVIETGENIGFGQANNIGIKKALLDNADFVFLLNQDAWVEPNCIDKLIQIQNRDTKYGILSPIHLNGNEDLIDKLVYHYISQNECGRGLFSDAINDNFKCPYPVEFVNAAIWLISRECIETVGMFDKMFFHYGEDGNYTQRVRYHGFKIGIVPSAKGYHDREDVLDKEVSLLKFTYLERAKAKVYLGDVNYRDSQFFKLLFSYLRSVSRDFIRHLIKLKFLHCSIIVKQFFYTILNFRDMYKLRTRCRNIFNGQK